MIAERLEKDVLEAKRWCQTHLNSQKKKYGNYIIAAKYVQTPDGKLHWFVAINNKRLRVKSNTILEGNYYCWSAKEISEMFDKRVLREYENSRENI